MSEAPSPEIEAFNEIVSGVAKYLFIVRGSDIQREAIEQLNVLLGDLAQWKAAAVRRDDEDAANKFLGCECVAQYLLEEITMWLDLKEGRAEKAWERLIAAQQAIVGAIRAHRGFAHLEQNARRMVEIEHLIFPPQVFLSASLIVGRQECNICGQEYEDCSHVKGRPYWGRFCSVRLSDVRLDHIAIVDEPANRLCRVVHFSDQGGKRNLMTWRLDATQSG